MKWSSKSCIVIRLSSFDIGMGGLFISICDLATPPIISLSIFVWTRLSSNSRIFLHSSKQSMASYFIAFKFLSVAKCSLSFLSSLVSCYFSFVNFLSFGIMLASLVPMADMALFLLSKFLSPNKLSSSRSLMFILLPISRICSSFCSAIGSKSLVIGETSLFEARGLTSCD